ncbi:MAG: formate/nitrite transporter family protein [Candidatus Kapabacteria bacterium]|nr:formate/nitrite transporter family protein [Candidatus Kapabacteria bacterium]
MNELKIDALLPAEMAEKAESLGVRKAGMPAFTMFMLSLLAGAFIALGAIFATTLSSGSMPVTSPDGTLLYSTNLPYGISRLLAGLAFSLGLILVVVGGAELFTGNNLIVMAWANKKVSAYSLLRNWTIVYIGNFIASIATAGLMFLAMQYTYGSNAIGITALKIAIAKCNLGFTQALALGLLGNALVCLAVWLTYSARTTMDKIIAIIFPVTAFVAAGFEHSIANMYFIPIALFIKEFDPNFVTSLGNKIQHIETLTWYAFFIKNLIPVTIGNIIGGGAFIGAIYWVIFLRDKKVEKS